MGWKENDLIDDLHAKETLCFVALCCVVFCCVVLCVCVTIHMVMPSCGRAVVWSCARLVPEKAVGHYSEASCSSLSKLTKPERSNLEASKQKTRLVLRVSVRARVRVSVGQCVAAPSQAPQASGRYTSK